MDLRAGRLPQSPQSSNSSSSSNNPFNGTETIRTEPNKFITFKDVYDYLSLDILSAGGSGPSGAVNDADLFYPFGITNYSLDGVGVGSTGVAAAAAATLNQSTTIFQNSNGTANGWNSTALWLGNGSILAGTTATIGFSGDGVSNGLGLGVAENGNAEIGGIIVTAATSIILGLMILITVIGKWPKNRALSLSFHTGKLISSFKFFETNLWLI